MQQVFLFNSENLKKEERLRFVKGSDGLLWFDVNEKAPAEIAFLTPINPQKVNKETLEKAIEPFAVHVPEDIEKTVRVSLKKKLLSGLGLAKKAGFAVLGLEKSKEVYQKGGVELAFLAEDAGADVSKRVHLWQNMLCQGLTKVELSQALGQENVSVVALKGGLQVQYVKIAWQRYQAWCQKI